MFGEKIWDKMSTYNVNRKPLLQYVIHPRGVYIRVTFNLSPSTLHLDFLHKLINYASGKRFSSLRVRILLRMSILITRHASASKYAKYVITIKC